MKSQGFIFNIREMGLNGYDFFYHQVDPQEYRIGRGAIDASFDAIQVQLYDLAVSRNHCRIFKKGSYGWMVEDMGSGNGTWLQKDRREPGSFERLAGPAQITDYSVLHVGTTTVSLRPLAEISRVVHKQSDYLEQISA